MIDTANRFALNGNITACDVYGNGHINRTCRVTTDTGKRYILQRINRAVFPDCDMLMHNISLVTGHLRAQGLDENHVLTIIPTREGKLYWQDAAGECWRVFAYVEGGKCLEQAENAGQFYQSGVAFGTFQRQLADFPADTLGEVIPRFHDTPNRYTAFKEAVAADVCGRAKEVQREIDAVLAHESEAGQLVEGLRSGQLPLRVTHNDTKLNNVILDEKTGEPLCVIDLDTVMPGAAAYDFGDSIRFGASTALEDERDLDKVTLSLPLMEAFSRGFVRACGAGMGGAERASLPVGAKLMTLENAVRFLTDHLQGDTYFAIHREGQNLDRCRTQLRLIEDMEKKWDDMRRIVEESA